MERGSTHEGPIAVPRDGCELRRLVDGDEMNQIHVRMEPGAAHPMHRHPGNEQVGHVLSGELTIETEDGERAVIAPGESYQVGAGVRHAVTNEGDEPAESVETFAPPREFDYWD